MRVPSIRLFGATLAGALLLGLLVQGPSPTAQAATEPVAAATVPPKVSVVSFNIQFLGNFKTRDDKAIADLLAPYDLVIIQELDAPPYAGTYPDGTPYPADPEAAKFFEEMKARGFSYVLSEEDTGTSDTIHLASSATEWWVAFYKPSTIQPAPDLYTGFLSDDRANNDDYERVPYAFAFRAGSEDLEFISVHLQPNAGSKNQARRKHELDSIAKWIAARPGPERDYVILGDMNIASCTELALDIPAGFTSLNSGCLTTTPKPGSKNPYDHVMFQSYTTAEIGTDFKVIDLVAAMRPSWNPANGVYPGDPYVHDRFRTTYSDHDPVTFWITVDGVDDD